MTKQESVPDWEQFSIEVETRLAEHLAALLGEILPGGVVLERNYGDLFPHELESYQGPTRLYGYFPAGERREFQERISRTLEAVGLGEADYSPLENQNWATAWQERYRPIPIGKKLAVVPTWLENPYPERIPIRIDPGMAFGSGTHPTTQLSLTLLEESLEEFTPRKMIDVGCGSGILSICSAKLGVKAVLGVDIDPDAIQVSYENAKGNGVSAAVSFRIGSVQDLLSQDSGSEKAPLVAANIIAPILIDLFGQGLGDLVLPGGRIILSGILVEQLPAILNCLEEGGFQPPETQQVGDWIGLAADKPSAK